MPQTTALTTVKLPLQPKTRPSTARKPSTPTRTDRYRYYLKRKNFSLDEIAAQTNCSVIQVSESFARMEEYMASVSNEEVDFAINQVVLQQITGVGKVIQKAMGAERRREVKIGKKKNGDDKFRVIKIADHDTRLKAVETLKTFADLTRPKGGGITLNANTQVNNGMGASTGDVIRGRSFEDIVRKKRLADNPDEEGEIVLDAEEGEIQSVEDELSDIGIDLDDEDDEDEEGDEE